MNFKILLEEELDPIHSRYLEEMFFWRSYLASPRFNPTPFSLLATTTTPDSLDDDLEQEASSRALAGAFLGILFGEDIELKEEFPKLLLSPIRRADGSSYQVDVNFVCRVCYLTALYSLGEKTYPEWWQKKVSEYLSLRWPEYKGERVNVALLERWSRWMTADFVAKQNAKRTWLNKLRFQALKVSLHGRILFRKAKFYFQTQLR